MVNANIDLVVAAGSTVLIDNRAKLRIARDTRVAIQKVTVHAGRRVINTCGQDPCCLGDGYFDVQSAELIVRAINLLDASSRGGDHREALCPAAGPVCEFDPQL